MWTWEVIRLAEKTLTAFAKVMNRKGITPEDIARDSGFSLGYIYKIRRGDQKPSLKGAALLAKLVGEPVDIFLDTNCPERTNEIAGQQEAPIALSGGTSRI